MEKKGIVDFLKSMSKTLDEDIKILEANIFETAGEKFNLASQNS
jgi:DNA polymerase-1